MREILFVVAAALVTAGAALFSIPLGLVVAGMALGAIVYLSE